MYCSWGPWSNAVGKAATFVSAAEYVVRHFRVWYLRDPQRPSRINVLGEIFSHQAAAQSSYSCGRSNDHMRQFHLSPHLQKHRISSNTTDAKRWRVVMRYVGKGNKQRSSVISCEGALGDVTRTEEKPRVLQHSQATGKPTAPPSVSYSPMGQRENKRHDFSLDPLFGN